MGGIKVEVIGQDGYVEYGNSIEIQFDLGSMTYKLIRGLSVVAEIHDVINTELTFSPDGEQFLMIYSAMLTWKVSHSG